MSDRADEGQSWFYVREGRRQGPFDRRGLVQALLDLEAPETALVWRSGLAAWTKAGELHELRIELPPPIPKDLVAGEPDPSPPAPPPPLPIEDGTVEAPDASSPGGEAKAADEEDGDEEEDDELESSPTDPSIPPGDAAEARRGRRRRRKHKHKHTDDKRKPRVLELLAMFLILALVLWYLLRRMNEVPSGTIIYQGSLSGAPASSASVSVRRPIPPPRPSWAPR